MVSPRIQSAHRTQGMPARRPKTARGMSSALLGMWRMKVATPVPIAIRPSMPPSQMPMYPKPTASAQGNHGPGAWSTKASAPQAALTTESRRNVGLDRTMPAMPTTMPITPNRTRKEGSSSRKGFGAGPRLPEAPMPGARYASRYPLAVATAEAIKTTNHGAPFPVTADLNEARDRREKRLASRSVAGWGQDEPARGGCIDDAARDSCVHQPVWTGRRNGYLPQLRTCGGVQDDDLGCRQRRQRQDGRLLIGGDIQNACLKVVLAPPQNAGLRIERVQSFGARLGTACIGL